MAQLSYFMTDADTLDFASFLVCQWECRFTLDGGAGPELSVLTKPEDVARCRDLDGFAPRFFVTSQHWTLYPLPVQRIDNRDGRVRWYVEQRYGGPAFDFHVSMPREEDGCWQIVIGWLTDYPWYYVKDHDHATFERPRSMVAAFQRVKRYLNTTGVRSRLLGSAKPGPWVLPSAHRAFAQGCWLRQGDWHFEPVGQR